MDDSDVVGRASYRKKEPFLSDSSESDEEEKITPNRKKGEALLSDFSESDGEENVGESLIVDSSESDENEKITLNRKKGEALVSDSSDSDAEERRTSNRNSLIVPESDHEDDDSDSSSTESEINSKSSADELLDAESFSGLSPILHNNVPSRLLRRSSEFKSFVEGTDIEASQFLSLHSSPKNEGLLIDSVLSNTSADRLINSVSKSKTDRTSDVQSSSLSGEAEYIDYSVSKSEADQDNDFGQDSLNSSAKKVNESEAGQIDDFDSAHDNFDSAHDNFDLSNASAAGINESVSKSEKEGSPSASSVVSDFRTASPDRNNYIDLTQSDSSLQNSPVGASRQLISNQRDVADIVAELSAVSNDLMVKQALLESINVNTLPDNGRNLMIKVAQLQKRKSDLEDEMHNNEGYMAQKSGLQQWENIREKPSATKQTTLNFQSAIKGEYRESEKSGSEKDSPESSRSDVSVMPEWGNLPKPDMTISGFGKQAMKTHLAEKTLTLEALSKLHNALKTCPTEETLAEDPKLLKVELLPHQKHGLAWMLWREQERPSGGILADDMGLGKTLSMISLILKQIENKENSEGEDSDSDDESPTWMSSKFSRMPRGGTLVVCPASLMAQWEREICKRVKRKTLSVDFYHGPKRETKPRRLAKFDVIITTYNLVSRESGVETAKNATKMKEKGPLFMIKWERIILDEAHMVRNHKSLMALGVCELVGKHRWCLTGTPIQNKELDLYALLKFLRCSPFDDLVVWKRWVDNKNAAGMQRLSAMMKSLMLRRTKEQLQEKGDLDCLPQKHFERIDVHLDPEELALYEKVALFSTTLFSQFLHQRAEKQQALDARYGFASRPVWEQSEGPDNQFSTTEELAMLHRKMKGVSEIKTHQILVLLLRLRQICCHPGLVKKMVVDGDLDLGGGVEDTSGLDVDLFHQMNALNINESTAESENEELDKSNVMSADNPVLDFERPSAKIRAILDLIEEKLLDSDDKAIIVSQWTSVLNVIAKFLKQLKIKFETLSGEVPVDKRQEIVNAINKEGSGPQVLLLSLTAGGVGLNLVGANHLMLVDIHWNPQLEAQACDRIYRVGQKKDVFIYRFITVNTIEERIKTIQDFKLTLAQNVLTGTRNTQASKLTLDDLKMLFLAPSQQVAGQEDEMPK